MELKRLIKDEDGNVWATWVLTPDQFGYLLQYAINSLLEEGVAKVADITQEELEKLRDESEEEFNLHMLEGMDKDDLPQA